MEAGKLLHRIAFLIAVSVGMSVAASTAFAANYRTQNFLIQAPSPELARAVGEAAERYRRDLAVHWLGQPIPPWPAPCPVRVVAGNLAAQGVTTYNRSPVRDFQMEVVGTPERILDSVLPHEVTHTVLATHFGRPLPRWADEGICTTVEHDAERSKHEAKLREFLASRRGIAMNRMFLLTEYPDDVLPLYAQGYSVCRFLIDQQGPQSFIKFLEGYMQRPSWTDNVREHYGYDSLAELQDYWLGWVAAGSGPVDRFVKANNTPSAVSSIASRGSNPAELSAPTNRLAAATVPATASASTAAANENGEAGWYKRRRMGDTSEREIDSTIVSVAIPQTGATRELLATPVPQRDLGMAPPDATSVPPSVKMSGHYSAAQPQPEQSFSGADFSTQTYSGQSSRNNYQNTPADPGPEPYYYGGQSSPARDSSGQFWR